MSTLDETFNVTEDGDQLPEETIDSNANDPNLPTEIAHQNIMDVYSTAAFAGYTEVLKNLSVCEPSQQARLSEAASLLMRLSIDAKNSKFDAYMKEKEYALKEYRTQRDLELKERRMELDERKFEAQNMKNVVDGDVQQGAKLDWDEVMAGLNGATKSSS